MVQKIKCVIWDLDNTIWDGVLSEDKEVKLNDNIKEIIEELDKEESCNLSPVKIIMTMLWLNSVNSVWMSIFYILR